jgi:hypothetical protein
MIQQMGVYKRNVLEKHRRIKNIRLDLWTNTMFPPLQWEKLHLTIWSWLKGGPLQGHMQFEVVCDLVWYDNKIEIIEKIHSLNLLGENSSKLFKNHPRKTTCQ